MPTPTPDRTPLPGTDDRGRYVYRVPLPNVGVSVMIYAEDYDSLIARGISGSWCWNGRSVVVGSRSGSTRTVARLLLNSPAGHRVHTRNGNNLDLRRDNLIAKPIRRYPRHTFTGRHRPL
ncbi:hypothetical protein OCUBac02_29540 [Bosea sp. ANAM02]|nr:hypothetical protein OCUBac02_29540 [Bosea sp. ANAM02]